MKKLLILISALITTSVFAQVNPTNLSFYQMEVVDTLKSFNVKSYTGNIRKVNDNAFVLDNYIEERGIFLIRKVKDKHIVFEAEEIQHLYLTLDKVDVVKDFIIIKYDYSGGARQTTWFNSFYVIINTSNSKIIRLQSEYQYEASDYPEQKSNESDEKYLKRIEKEGKTVSESCTSKIKFDGLFLNVSRTYRNNCKECVETGTYKLVKDEFIKLKR